MTVPVLRTIARGYPEPSDCYVINAQAGYFFVKITVRERLNIRREKDLSIPASMPSKKHTRL